MVMRASCQSWPGSLAASERQPPGPAPGQRPAGRRV